jgi:hypothetical protein
MPAGEKIDLRVSLTDHLMPASFQNSDCSLSLTDAVFSQGDAPALPFHSAADLLHVLHMLRC